MGHAQRRGVVRLGQRARGLARPALDLRVRLVPARRGLPVPASHLERDWTQPYPASDAVEQAWLVVYRDQTAPLIEYYRRDSRLREVNGVGALDEVYGALVAALKPDRV